MPKLSLLNLVLPFCEPQVVNTRARIFFLIYHR